MLPQKMEEPPHWGEEMWERAVSTDRGSGVIVTSHMMFHVGGALN